MIKKVILSFVFLLALSAPFASISAESDADRLQKLNDQIRQYEEQINNLQAQASTLANQVAQFDAQIKLTELKIDQTREQILLLGGRIDQLTLSLDNLNDAFSSRAVETYKMSRVDNSPTILLADDLSEAVSRYHYLQRIQEADRDLLARLQEAQNTYQEQKGDLEELEQVLGVQKEALDSQKAAKAQLLTITKNSEKTYQGLLEKARAEYEAIQAIIAGGGEETEIGHVNEGDIIASIINKPSCNSSGAHLHFMVVNGNSIQDPAGFLNNRDVVWDNSPDGPFSFSGSWNWPLNNSIRITQGYGWTYYAKELGYYRDKNGELHPHSGIDIVGSDLTVKAVKSGILYRGAYNIGCQLRYVRVDHDDGDLETYYLHINY